jgi:hypothetical protein
LRAHAVVAYEIGSDNTFEQVIAVEMGNPPIDPVGLVQTFQFEHGFKVSVEVSVGPTINWLMGWKALPR